jgi:hypothetical protein
MRKRHESIHFRPEVDHNVRSLALEAVICLQKIIGEQFSAFGPQPWFLTDIPGEIYIKEEWELKPFVQKVYLPNGLLVGPRHTIEAMAPRITVKDSDRDGVRGTGADAQFAQARHEFSDGDQRG